MNWTKEKPTKPGKYAAIHLHQTSGGYAKAKLISVAEDLVPPGRLNQDPNAPFNWDADQTPIEEWVKVLIVWETGGDGPESLDWYTWFCEIEFPPVPEEVAKIQAGELVKEQERLGLSSQSDL